ncbi:lipopolysaccharide biosynthesis protein [Mesorhizobium sp. SP-1A]|uniref:lipopolysaccharide biosynthesis protein n=1 Tax=Mesorhizobium sp. SP-1A TaxID=3077840 RepID=UPI0028F72B63|nr:oligosaccharide flippase family protein [Mesorhizobium sp. SP-1A]
MDQTGPLPERQRWKLLRWLGREGSPNGGVQRAAGAAFFIRIANAAIAYLSQIIMARWMGAFEYGVYVYVWTWVLLIGTVSDLGFAVTAQRFIPRYTQENDLDRVRGFIHASRWVPGFFVTLLAVAAALSIWLLSGRMDAYLVFPLYLACLALPPYGLTGAQDGVARSFGWINLALVPPFILRPLLLLAIMLALFAAGLPLDAATAMWAAVAATWLTAIGQILVLDRRVDTRVEQGPRAYSHRLWLVSALPILFANVFQFMLSYVGVFLLQAFRSPNDVAVFYAATKVTAIVSMVYFAVSASAAYRFAALEAAGDRPGLERFYAGSIRWMFWPTVLVGGGILAVGKPLLWLFGQEFTAGYGLMWVMVAGLALRTAIGPGEQFLNMMGQQRTSATIYAAAFVLNLIFCFLLIPQWGAMGAAVAATVSIVLESALIYATMRRRFGISAFIAPRERDS